MVAFALFVWSGAVVAAESRADRLIAEGVQLRIKSRYQDALERFQEAHALEPSPVTLAQMGLAEADLHRWSDAEAHLTEALASRGNPWIEKNRGGLDEPLRKLRLHIGLVRVTGPLGAEVLIDGKVVGRLPLDEPLHVIEGRVHMEGRAPGRQSAASDVVVPGAGEITLHLDLPLIVAPPAAAVSPVPGNPVNLHPSDPTAAPGREAATWKTRTGVGLLVGAAGLLTWGVVWIAIDGHQQSCSSSAVTCQKYETGGKGWMLVGLGAVAAAGGGLLLYLGGRGDSSDLAFHISPTGAQFLGHF